MVKEINIALLHIEAAEAALRGVRAELRKAEEYAHPDDVRVFAAAYDVADEALGSLYTIQDKAEDLAGMLEDEEVE